ncbi:hypothetical protein BDW22DRAFT_1360063 [Trametopsis cervina]|nr:hypothetical protein BDW22DRAFT_1360063 [Trametopsis cervina]
MLPTTPSTQAGPLSPLVTALDGDAPHDLPSHEEGAEEQDGDGQYPTESFQLSGPSADMISEEDAALSSVPLTSDPMLLHVGFESTGIALTPLQLGEGSPKQGRSDTVSSDETVKAQDPATDVPPGFRLAFVGENIVVPTVEMTRLRRPPRIYEALVTILESERLKGNTRMPSSQVGANLREIDKHIYTKAGCTKLKEYIQKAVKDGVVLSGSLSGGLLDNGNIWVALHPVYHGNAPEPVQVALPLV